MKIDFNIKDKLYVLKSTNQITTLILFVTIKNTKLAKYRFQYYVIFGSVYGH